MSHWHFRCSNGTNCRPGQLLTVVFFQSDDRSSMYLGDKPQRILYLRFSYTIEVAGESFAQIRFKKVVYMFLYIFRSSRNYKNDFLIFDVQLLFFYNEIQNTHVLGMYRPVIGFLRYIYWSNGKFPFTSIESLWIQPFFGLYYWGGGGGQSLC